MRSIVVAAAVFVVIIVVVVASVVATRKSKNKSPTPVPTPAPTSTLASTPTSSILSSTATATPTIVPPVPVDRGPGLLFSPENWYTFNNNDGEVSYWAQSYADDTSADSLRTLKEYSDTVPRATDMQFQIRHVPITWPNSTLDTGERTYWIYCLSSGPDVRLTMLADEWERGSSGISSNLHFHPQPKDHTNAAQYWYFEEVDGPVDGSWYKLYNMKAGHDYPAAFQSKWSNPLLWTPSHPASWEQWRVEAMIRVVNSEEEFTWQIDPGRMWIPISRYRKVAMVRVYIFEDKHNGFSNHQSEFLNCHAQTRAISPPYHTNMRYFQIGVWSSVCDKRVFVIGAKFSRIRHSRDATTPTPHRSAAQ